MEQTRQVLGGWDLYAKRSRVQRDVRELLNTSASGAHCSLPSVHSPTSPAHIYPFASRSSFAPCKRDDRYT